MILPICRGISRHEEIICYHQMCFFQDQSAPKPIFGPAGEAYDAPLDPLDGWGGARRRLRLLNLDALGVSISVGACGTSLVSLPIFKFLPTPFLTSTV